MLQLLFKGDRYAHTTQLDAPTKGAHEKEMCMSHPTNRGERQTIRRTKGMKRIKEDRAQHGNDHSCGCFNTSGRGAEFARFADYPTVCSCDVCGNPRKWFGERTLQEIKSDS